MRTIMEVAGMRAVHCVRAVQTAMAMLPGIQWCEVSMGRVELEHDGGAITAARRSSGCSAGGDGAGLAWMWVLGVAMGPLVMRRRRGRNS